MSFVKLAQTMKNIVPVMVMVFQYLNSVSYFFFFSQPQWVDVVWSTLNHRLLGGGQFYSRGSIHFQITWKKTRKPSKPYSSGCAHRFSILSGKNV